MAQTHRRPVYLKAKPCLSLTIWKLPTVTRRRVGQISYLARKPHRKDTPKYTFKSGLLWLEFYLS